MITIKTQKELFFDCINNQGVLKFDDGFRFPHNNKMVNVRWVKVSDMIRLLKEHVCYNPKDIARMVRELNELSQS